MDYSNTNLSGKDLFKKNARWEGQKFKINYLKKQVEDLRLIDTNGKHEKFINDIDELLDHGLKLSEAQTKYLDGLFNQIFGERT